MSTSYIICSTNEQNWVGIGVLKSCTFYHVCTWNCSFYHICTCKAVRFTIFVHEICNTCFHLCALGLSPCLTHDLLEGIVLYDMMLYLDYFMRKNQFTLDFLNFQIDNFGYYGHDKLSSQKLLPNLPQNFQAVFQKTGAFWEFFPR